MATFRLCEPSRSVGVTVWRRRTRRRWAYRRAKIAASVCLSGNRPGGRHRFRRRQRRRLSAGSVNRRPNRTVVRGTRAELLELRSGPGKWTDPAAVKWSAGSPDRPAFLTPVCETTRRRGPDADR
ncbi:hypothetical protein Pen02_53560 [Plantactinospora endophytica]|uniref:Uncharacterized protein n=1 Tax=Plantactinospora endophytica TaxID=673535 RepID=A0ABQ4E6S3_9ACTN|nr:hypothetical protein Pen02_53560 [Plantactinospora endophytica]